MAWLAARGWEPANLTWISRDRALWLPSGLLTHIEMPRTSFYGMGTFLQRSEAFSTLCPKMLHGGCHGREPVLSVLPINWDMRSCPLGRDGQRTGGLSWRSWPWAPRSASTPRFPRPQASKCMELVFWLFWVPFSEGPQPQSCEFP